VNCRKQLKIIQDSGVEENRRKLEEHARERARIEAVNARQRERERVEKQRQEDLAIQRELTLQHHMKQVCLVCRCGSCDSCRLIYPKSVFFF
jgi:hypothetical protein